MIMPNLFASVALLLWIPIGLSLFALLRPPVAAAVTLIGASLLLPCAYGFDFPGLPTLDRELIASLAALAGCVVFAPQRLRGRHPGQGIELLAVLLVLGALATTLVNRDPTDTAPALSFHDALSTGIRQVLRFWLPFFIGRALFRSAAELRTLLLVLTVAGLLYSLPILWEIRMSPNLHLYVYGYSGAVFSQQIRAGGYRPMVFVGHGLALAMFVLSATLAAVGLARSRARIGSIKASWAAGYLFAILILCRSAAAMIYGIVAAPLIWLLRPAAQARLILAVALLVITYPVSRALDWFPTATLVRVSDFFSEDRAGSLEFRFYNEDILLARARERLWFGWGGWGRSNDIPADTATGRPITDGYWIIALGQEGAVGFLSAFGLLLAPAAMAARRLQRGRAPEGTTLATVAWIVIMNAVDLLPNGFLTARAIFIAGALTGALQGGRTAVARHPRRKPAERPTSALLHADAELAKTGRAALRPRTHS